MTLTPCPSLKGVPYRAAIVPGLQPRVSPSTVQVETAKGCGACDLPSTAKTSIRGTHAGTPYVRVTMWVQRSTPDSPLAPLTSQEAWLGSLGTTAAPCSTGSDHILEGGATGPGVWVSLVMSHAGFAGRYAGHMWGHWCPRDLQGACFGSCGCPAAVAMTIDALHVNHTSEGTQTDTDHPCIRWGETPA